MFAVWERELPDGTYKPLAVDAQKKIETAFTKRRRRLSTGVGPEPVNKVVDIGGDRLADVDDMLLLAAHPAPLHRRINTAAMFKAIHTLASSKTWAVEAVPVRYLMPQPNPEHPPRGYFAFKVTTINGLWCTDLLCRLPQLLAALPSYGRLWTPAQLQSLPRHEVTGRPLGLHIQCTRSQARRLGAGAPVSEAVDRLPFSDALLGKENCVFRFDMSNGPSIFRSGAYEYLVASGTCDHEWANERTTTAWHMVLATSGGTNHGIALNQT